AHAVIRAPAHIACAAKILPAGIERLDVLGVVLFFGVLRPLLHLLADMRLVLEVVLAGIKNILVGDFNGSGFFVGIIYARHNAMVPILAAFAALRCLKVGRHQSIIAGTAVWTLGLLLGSDASLRGFLAVELLVRLHLRLPHVRMVLLVIVAFRTRLAPEFFRFLGGVGRAHGGFPDHLVFRQASLEELVLFPFHLDRTHLGVRITFFEERGVLLALGRLQLWIGLHHTLALLAAVLHHLCRPATGKQRRVDALRAAAIYEDRAARAFHQRMIHVFCHFFGRIVQVLRRDVDIKTLFGLRGIAPGVVLAVLGRKIGVRVVLVGGILGIVVHLQQGV